MTGLTVLALEQTSVTDAGLEQLDNFPNLEEFSLLQCQTVTDAGLKHLKKLTKLKELNLSVTFVSQEAAKQLQAALPDCKIQG